jgi:NADPH-dependent glutamate synthase beta subunit-like oxidoreductase
MCISKQPKVAGKWRFPGDCRRSQDLMVRAINEGHEAAREIDRDLSARRDSDS